MRYIDADGHVEENPATFDDKYLDPAFRPVRPRVVRDNELVYWSIDEQLFPRRVGRGCNNLGTPTNYEGKPSIHTMGKPESIPCMELSDLKARLDIMDEEEIAVQVLYTTLFLAYPLSSDPRLVTALCSSYNRWLGDRLGNHERLKWAAVANLDEADQAVKQVREAKRLGASAVMVLGTAGDRQLDHPSLFQFYETLCQEKLPVSRSRRLGLSIDQQSLFAYLSLRRSCVSFPRSHGVCRADQRRRSRPFSRSQSGFLGSRLHVGPLHDRSAQSPLPKPGEKTCAVSAPDQAHPAVAGHGLHQERQSLLQRRAGRFHPAAGTGLGGREAGRHGNGHAPRRPRALRRAPPAREKRFKRCGDGKYSAK